MNDKTHAGGAKEHNSKYMIRNHPIVLQSRGFCLADLSTTGTTHYLLEPVKCPKDVAPPPFLPGFHEQ